MGEYVNKTVTIEPHPGTGVPSASIHPCKHAVVLKTLTDTMIENGAKNIKSNKALLIFLKFMNSVIPTIEYDFA